MKDCKSIFLKAVLIEKQKQKNYTRNNLSLHKATQMTPPP